MSSIERDTTCTKCGYQHATYIWSGNGYEQTFCYQCGYFHKQDYENEDGHTESRGGIGSFKICYNNGMSEGGGLIALRTIAEHKRDFRCDMRALDVKRIELSLLLNGKWTKVVLKDFPKSQPKTFRNGKESCPAPVQPVNMPRPAPSLAEMTEDVPY